MTVAAVLWDADGVLQRHGDGWQAAYERLGGVSEAFIADAWAAEQPLMVGGDFVAALTEVAHRHGIAVPVEQLLSRWRSIEPDPLALEMVRRVRAAGTRCYLATNQNTYRAQVMRETLGYDRHLDGAFYSCELGVAKPDPAYFEAILTELSLPGDQVLFVDDNQPNVDGARRAGLRAVRWTHGDGLAALHERLVRHGLRI